VLEAFAATAPFPVRIDRNVQPLGYGENFMQAARRCTGDWIAFCDQDDVWLPTKLQTCADAIARHGPDLRLIVHEATVVDEDLKRTGALYGRSTDELHAALSLPPEWFCLGLTQIFSAQLVRDLPISPRLSFPWHRHREAHDVWVALLANATGSILLLADSLLLYRRHQASVTTSAANSRWARVATGLKNNGFEYAQRARYLLEAGERLATLADAGSSPVLQERLREASRQIQRYATCMTDRAGAYAAETPGGAAARIAALAWKGGYAEQPWPIGRARLLKDLAMAPLSVAIRR
jgi:glycosyltransferase involved in cell wall biosynthesis